MFQITCECGQVFECESSWQELCPVCDLADKGNGFPVEQRGPSDLQLAILARREVLAQEREEREWRDSQVTGEEWDAAFAHLAAREWPLAPSQEEQHAEWVASLPKPLPVEGDDELLWAAGLALSAVMLLIVVATRLIVG
jgi:hypothetical protein